MNVRKLILNQAGFPGVTRDELKKIVICPHRRRKCNRLRGHSGPCQHPFHQDQWEKKKSKKAKKIAADVSDSIYQEFGIVIPIASHKYPSVDWLHANLSEINLLFIQNIFPFLIS